ncbi:hypothetical protein BU26DRAFT_154434 [Trematosphaeria pertusa]|uniref:Uncharacterized protein n=1 Tax=Trematosphaeria pertusa TaxID=390896 RepID=A0A6A6IYH1_9PLEO|nr:uncharacterized protein BU26DRAFT_154434 [Trematosphaeria pertusa]KAF2255358.1 hypothetical protein BU26DRAFT_154434 [Trematosphaeria pertusa]
MHEKDPPQLAIWHLNPWQDRQLAIVVECFSRLKHLRLRFAIALAPDNMFGYLWKLDLSRLEDGKLQLSKLEIVISKGVEYLGPERNAIFQAFEREVCRVGRAVVKGEREARLDFREEKVKIEPPQLKSHRRYFYYPGYHNIPATQNVQLSIHGEARDALSWWFEFTKAGEMAKVRCSKEE